MHKIKAVVFDWAGTMVDFGALAPGVAFVRAFDACGVTVSLTDARQPMGHNQRDHVAALLAKPHIAARWQAAQGRAPDAQAVQGLLERLGPLTAAVAAEHADLVPGARDTVQWLRDGGIRIGSTTGYSRATMARVSPIAAAQGYVPDTLVCADDLPEGRPGPLMMYKCFTDLAVHPPGCVIKVDDTEAGIHEGGAAGCLTVGVALSGHHAGLSLAEMSALPEARRNEIRRRARAALKAAGAHHIIDTVADLPSLMQTFA